MRYSRIKYKRGYMVKSTQPGVQSVPVYEKIKDEHDNVIPIKDRVLIGYRYIRHYGVEALKIYN